MTSGYVDEDGNDLDSIFSALGNNVPAARTGYQVEGTDLSLRYYPLAAGGTQVEATGFLANGADLNTIFGFVPPEYLDAWSVSGWGGAAQGEPDWTGVVNGVAAQISEFVPITTVQSSPLAFVANAVYDSPGYETPHNPNSGTFVQLTAPYTPAPGFTTTGFVISDVVVSGSQPNVTPYSSLSVTLAETSNAQVNPNTVEFNAPDSFSPDFSFMLTPQVKDINNNPSAGTPLLVTLSYTLEATLE